MWRVGCLFCSFFRIWGVSRRAKIRGASDFILVSYGHLLLGFFGNRKHGGHDIVLDGMLGFWEMAESAFRSLLSCMARVWFLGRKSFLSIC
jgi:hypothetical protein